MTDELKPVRCGCGGEAWTDYIIGEPSEGVGWFVCCKNCEIQLPPEYDTETEAIEAWNRAMGGNVQECAKDARCSERTAKVKINWASYSDERGVNIIHIPYAYRCENCDCCLERTYNGRDIHYCPACGCRLEWE